MRLQGRVGDTGKHRSHVVLLVQNIEFCTSGIDVPGLVKAWVLLEKGNTIEGFDLKVYLPYLFYHASEQSQLLPALQTVLGAGIQASSLRQTVLFEFGVVVVQVRVEGLCHPL